MKWHWLLILAVLVVLTGCSPRKSERQDLPRGIQITVRPNVYRMVDEEAGISCLPLSETNLDY